MRSTDSVSFVRPLRLLATAMVAASIAYTLFAVTVIVWGTLYIINVFRPLL